MAYRKKNWSSQRALIVLVLLAIAYVGVADAKPLRGLDAARTPNGNKHDFSSGNTGNAFHSEEIDQVCIFCHTPHGATAQSTLWNRPEPTGASAYALNPSVAIKTNPAAQDASGYKNDNPATYPNGSTRLCMSCHDGVTAIGAFLNGDRPSFSDTTMTMTATAVDLATSHPVSFKYDGAVRDAINVVHGGGYRLPTDAPPSTALVPLDGQGRMQCTTCHDPHEDTRSVDVPPFWRHIAAVPADSYDEVCLACHIALPVPGSPHL